MAAIKKLNDINKVKSDEFYTPRKAVECLIEMIKPEVFENKIVYLPCDTDESFFTIVFKEWKEKLKYRELIYTSDDFRTHEDIFEKADVVITNPPFSLTSELCKIMSKYNNNCFIISFPTTTEYLWKYDYEVFRYKARFDEKTTMFITPPGTVNFDMKPANTWTYTIVTNDISQTFYKRRKHNIITLLKDLDTLEYYDEFTYNDNKVLNINNIYKVPLDYDGYFGIPGTSLMANTDILDNIHVIKNIKKRSVNGKKKFVRVLCEWKDFDNNKKYYKNKED